MRGAGRAAGVWLACAGLAVAGPAAPSVEMGETLLPSPVKRVADGAVVIAGRARGSAVVRVRVTASAGGSWEARPRPEEGRFSCRYPQDFSGASALAPAVLYVDATDAEDFGGAGALEHQAEAVVIVAGPAVGPPPDLPQIFTDDFIDATGKKDADGAQFARNRTLVNLFLRSRAATLMRVERPAFDLAKPEDFAWFKDTASLYDFDHRDRDWAQPLGHRVARGFWQAVWNRWFNATNDHPWDGNPANRAPGNFRPYTFANDPADLAVLHALLRPARTVVADHRSGLLMEVMENILALQHRGAENFALAEAGGRQEHYTAGAFHYGMFETGEWLTEGTGWFANPGFRDFAAGGVFNARCVWAMGEVLRADPAGPLAKRLREAIPLAARFCLHDGLARRYTRRTAGGLPVWGRPGEHGYLVLGLVAASDVAPELPVVLDPALPPRPLREVCREALDALVDSAGPDGTWSTYADVDAVNIAALAAGARSFSAKPGAVKWKTAACRAADVWLGLQSLPAERTEPTPLFSHRKDGGMTWHLGQEKHGHVSLYLNGHWLHALAALHGVTKEARYLDRANGIAAWFCGRNPLHVRLLNEIGAVNNRVTDSDGDGIEDRITWDGYPESTAFFQIGLVQLMRQ